MRALVFDCETTGLIKNRLVPLDQQPRIIEFFGQLVDTETDETLEELEFFCDPGIQIEPIITRITGIKPEQLRGQPAFKHFAPQVIALIGKADALVAHNISFDMGMVENDLKRAGHEVNWPPRLICTVEQTEWMRGHRLNLSALHEELFGEPFAGAHRARVDVDALTRCFLELVKRGEL